MQQHRHLLLQSLLKKHTAPIDVAISTPASTEKVDLQKEVRRLDSISKTRVDTIQLAIQREIERMNLIEKAALDTLKVALREETSIKSTSPDQRSTTPIEKKEDKVASTQKAGNEQKAVLQKEVAPSNSAPSASSSLPFEKYQREQASANAKSATNQEISENVSINTNTEQPATDASVTTKSPAPKIHTITSTPDISAINTPAYNENNSPATTKKATEGTNPFANYRNR